VTFHKLIPGHPKGGRHENGYAATAVQRTLKEGRKGRRKEGKEKEGGDKVI
jgi:hypothetical protein